MLLTLPNSPIWSPPVLWHGRMDYPITRSTPILGVHPPIVIPDNVRSRFLGDVVVQFLVEPDKSDRIVRVWQKFVYVDSKGNIWLVPEGAVLNGASIPRILWTLYGSPFVGDYRRAALVHDYGCAIRSRPAKLTHAAFYDGCRTDQLRRSKAFVMWSMVEAFGPNWRVESETNKVETNLAS